MIDTPDSVENFPNSGGGKTDPLVNDRIEKGGSIISETTFASSNQAICKITSRSRR